MGKIIKLTQGAYYSLPISFAGFQNVLEIPVWDSSKTPLCEQSLYVRTCSGTCLKPRIILNPIYTLHFSYKSSFEYITVIHMMKFNL